MVGRLLIRKHEERRKNQNGHRDRAWSASHCDWNCGVCASLQRAETFLTRMTTMVNQLRTVEGGGTVCETQPLLQSLLVSL